MVRDPSRYCKCIPDHQLESMFCEKQPTGLLEDRDNIERTDNVEKVSGLFQSALKTRQQKAGLRFSADESSDDESKPNERYFNVLRRVSRTIDMNGDGVVFDHAEDEGAPTISRTRTTGLLEPRKQDSFDP